MEEEVKCKNEQKNKITTIKSKMVDYINNYKIDLNNEFKMKLEKYENESKERSERYKNELANLIETKSEKLEKDLNLLLSDLAAETYSEEFNEIKKILEQKLEKINLDKISITSNDKSSVSSDKNANRNSIPLTEKGKKNFYQILKNFGKQEKIPNREINGEFLYDIIYDSVINKIKIIYDDSDPKKKIYEDEKKFVKGFRGHIDKKLSKLNDMKINYDSDSEGELLY